MNQHTQKPVPFLATFDVDRKPLGWPLPHQIINGFAGQGGIAPGLGLHLCDGSFEPGGTKAAIRKAASSLVAHGLGRDHCASPPAIRVGQAMRRHAIDGNRNQAGGEIGWRLRQACGGQNSIDGWSAKLRVSTFLDADFGRVHKSEFIRRYRPGKSCKRGRKQPNRLDHSIAIPPFTWRVSPVT